MNPKNFGVARGLGSSEGVVNVYESVHIFDNNSVTFFVPVFLLAPIV